MNYVVSKQIDDLGRVVLPVALRRKYHLNEKAFVDIYSEGSTVIIKASEECCVSCCGTEDVTTFNSISLCKTCLLKFNKLIG